MVQQAAMATRAGSLTLTERAAAAVVAAADHLGIPAAELPQTALRCQLEFVRHGLEQRLALSHDSGDQSAPTAELLISVLTVQCEVLDHDLFRRLRSLTKIRNALEELRGLSPREMIHAAPVVLSRELASGGQ